MLRYDEKLNLVALETLGSAQRTGFALGAAARLVKSYQAFAKTTKNFDPSALRHVQSRTKHLLTAMHDPAARAEVDAILTQLDPMMELICNIPGLAAALCEDAIAATTYALRCFLDPTPREAAWAARRSYEATDKLAIEAFGFPDSKDAETRLLSHPLIQQELARQATDLTLLQGAKDLVPESLWSNADILDHPPHP